MLTLFFRKMQGGSSSKQESFPPNVSFELVVQPFIFYLNISKINGPMFFFFLPYFLSSFLPFFLTYLLTSLKSVLPQKLTGSQPVKKFPALFGNRRFITALTSGRHLYLSWARSIQTMSPNPTSCRSIWYYTSICAWVFQAFFLTCRFVEKDTIFDHWRHSFVILTPIQNIAQKLGSGCTENNAEALFLVDCSLRSSRD